MKTKIKLNLPKKPEPVPSEPGQFDGQISAEEFDGVVEEAVAEEAPAKTDEWIGSDLFVGFPCYKSTNPVTAWCLVALAKDLGDRVRMDMEIGDAMIYHARNRLAQKFLESKANWLLFIDDDMIVPIGRPDFLRQMARLPSDYPAEPAGLHVVHRLIGHNLPLVGATYFARHPKGRAINSLNGDAEYRAAASGFMDRVFPCEWMGTGCMLIHRDVFTKMMEKFPELEPTDDEMPWNFFQPGVDGRGEDIAFCQRALEIGIQPHIDAQLHAIHVGHGTYGVHTSTFNEILI